MKEVIPRKIKILITGANGQLGRCLQDVSETIPNYDFHFKTSKELDVTNQKHINILFAKEEFNYCINCAAYTAVDKAESEQEIAYFVNSQGVKNLAEACKTANTILIHISTDFVFDGTKGAPYTVDDLPNPINVYGLSKLKGEQYVQDILEQFFIIRTSWVYSEYGNNFVKTMLRLGTEGEELSVVDDQLGSPTYAGDLAQAIMAIITSTATNFGVHHYTNIGVISWFDLAVEIFGFCKNRVIVNPIDSSRYHMEAKRPKYSVLFNNEPINFKLFTWKNSLHKMLIKYNNI